MECNQEELATQNSHETSPETDHGAPYQDPDESDYRFVSSFAKRETEFNNNRQEFATLDLLFEFPQPLARSIPSNNGIIRWGRDYIPVSKKHISTWDAFTEENVNLMFHDFLLAREYQFNSKELNLAYWNTRGVDPRDLAAEYQIADWFSSRVWSAAIDFALEKSAGELQERVNSRDALAVKGLQEGAEIQVKKGNRRRLVRPEWSVYYRTDSGRNSKESRMPGEGPSQQEIPVVPGDFKQHMRFDPAELAGPARMSRGVYATLGKVLMYCELTKTRYSFIVSGDEVTLLRFYLVGGSRKRYGMHYVVLPWAKMEGRMLAWKAIWALVMLSMNDQHRPIASEDDTRDLNEWARFQEKGQTVWANHISKIVVADGKQADEFRVVDASRDEFAAQLDQYSEVQAAGSRPLTCHTVVCKGTGTVTYRIPPH
ncbi:hypothetical protein PG984_011597 [Apiospora sp. TS-2023a]